MTQTPTLIATLYRTWNEHRRDARTRRHMSRLNNHLRRDAGLPPLGPAPRNPFTEGW